MNTVSIIVLIVLAVLTIVQVMRISEISSSIQGGKDNQVSEKDNDTQGKLLLLVGMGFVISVLVMYWAWGALQGLSILMSLLATGFAKL